jgi:hypothetical protein
LNEKNRGHRGYTNADLFFNHNRCFACEGTLSAIVIGRDALPRDPRQVRAMVMSSPAPPMVDTLRRVRRRMS